MLALARREGETILVYPSQDVDPDMTVAELFKDGPIHIEIGNITSKQAKILIGAPDSLKVDRLEVVQKKCNNSGAQTDEESFSSALQQKQYFAEFITAYVALKCFSKL